MTEPVVLTESLTRHYGARRGIERLDLAVPEGSLFGFLGPNGSGKTTTIRVLLGFLKPAGGKARVLGLDPWRNPARIKEEVGYLPGDLRLWPWLTGAVALRLFGAIRRRDIVPAGRELAERFDLDLHVRAREMSRGTRQKLGLVLAMAHRPRLLILDEPTASLDPLMQDRLLRHLRELSAAGHTVFFSSHTLGEVDELCDRVAILRDGRLVEAATLDDLRRRSPRQVAIRFRPGDEHLPPPPPFLEVVQRSPREWSGLIRGSSVELVQWAATQPLEDLVIAPPALDALFRRIYAEKGER
jgi:ABC-2 type transport system ATP-binding protein